MTKRLSDRPVLPPGPRGAQIGAFTRDPLLFFQQNVERCGPIVLYRSLPLPYLPFFNPPHLILADPDQMWLVHQEKKATGLLHFDREGILELSIARAFVGEGLATSSGEHHRYFRKLLQPAFSGESLRRYREMFYAVSVRELESWDTSVPVDVPQALLRLTLRNACAAFLGLSLDGELLTRIQRGIEATNRYFSEMLRSGQMFPLWIPTRRNLWFRGELRLLHTAIDSLIRERRAQLGRGETYPGDVVSLLLGARDRDGRPLPYKDIRDQVMTLLIAGNETTSAALTWALYELARPGNEKVQEKLQEEADRELQEEILPDVHKLPYARMAFQEAMRLYPPAAWSMRRAQDEVVLCGKRVPPGTVINLVYYLIQRDKRRWGADAETFNPERFSRERHEQFPRHAYTPFAQGAHKCLGEPAALDEGTLVLALLARRFSFSWMSDQEAVPEQQTMLWPKGGLCLRVRRRQAIPGG